MLATRTLKNSSRLLEYIPKNLKRSTRGTLLSKLSCSTLSLKDSQLNSLFTNFFIQLKTNVNIQLKTNNKRGEAKTSPQPKIHVVKP